MEHSALEQLGKESRIAVLSVDVFDTLLFRAVNEPPEVFVVVHEQHPDLFPSHIDKWEWSELRIRAEKSARKERILSTGSREVTLEDIYNCIPLSIFPRREEIMVAEFEAEKEVCFLNSRMADLITQTKSRCGCQVVICSDMYLGRERMIELLKAVGFDMSMVDEVFVSCDFGVSKRTKGLYSIILDRMGISPSEMLHIGDNVYSDIGVAKELGIRTCYYNLVSNRLERHPYLEMETELYKSACAEVAAVRLLSAGGASSLPDEARVWHELGAMIAGPFLAGATEWVLDIAEANDIRVIHPLMREGAFLTTLLQKAAEYRGSRMTVTPLYVSRKALFLPSLATEPADEAHLTYIADTNGLRIRDIFNILGVEDHSAPFENYLDIESKQSKNIMFGEASLYSAMIDHLLSAEVGRAIQQRAKQAFDRLARYLRQEGLGQRAITLDLGFRGSMQRCLEQVIRAAGLSDGYMHLLLIGRTQVADKILDGVDVRGYLGTCRGSDEWMAKINIWLLELMLMCDQGTTLGYEEREGRIHPVLADSSQSLDIQMQQIRWIQQGILDYQHEYLNVGSANRFVRNCKRKPEELFKPLFRLFGSPLKDEAELFGHWRYDQNFGAQQWMDVLDADRAARLSKIGLEAFLVERAGRDTEWYPGLMVMDDPLVFLKRLYAERNAIQLLKRVLYAEKICRECPPNESVVIAGAGLAGKSLFRYLSIAQAPFAIETFIDKDERLHGETIWGIPVKPYHSPLNSRYYVVGSLAFEAEIREQILRAKGGDVRVICSSRQEVGS